MAHAPLSVVIHGHFYQPPRDDPWLEVIPPQPTAAPWHDWNVRIERECYRAVVASRLLDHEGRVRRVMNTLSFMSFNVGPTLLNWLAREAPRTYQKVLDADRVSAERLGHGNALAMPYHHPILPLSEPRDRRTEIRWGIADFRHHFGRDPEGMWLPETAVDEPTLEALAEAGIRFTVLGPNQVATPPPGGGPARFTTSSGREIAIFVYDGGLSHDVAFGDLLEDGGQWADRLAELDTTSRGENRRLRSMATDGETFGHHHAFGEMALARALEQLASRSDVRVENFASVLGRQPPTTEVELVEPSSWSCSHGVERWRANCGCRIDGSVDSDQSWRGPLREALSWLADRLHHRFEAEGGGLLRNPWAARDAYVAVVDSRDCEERMDFVRTWQRQALADHERIRATELLEMEANALRLFTSCAWFFDHVGGVEARQVMAYAARAIELSGESVELEAGLLKRLADAVGNDPAEVSGAEVYLEVRPAKPRWAQVAAAAAFAAAYSADGPARAAWGAYTTSHSGATLQVEHVCTGRAWSLDSQVTGTPLTDGVATLRRHESDVGYTIAWLDLPDALRDGVARRLAKSLLGPEVHPVAWRAESDTARVVERLQVELSSCIGEIEGVKESPNELPRAQTGGPANRRGEALSQCVTRILRVLDALAAFGAAVPFDPEARLWELMSGASDLAESLEPLRTRLPFSRAP